MSQGDDQADLDQWKSDRDEFKRWRDADRETDDEPARESNPLADLLVFLSDGYHTGTLQARALAFLWVLRPDLVAVDKRSGTCKAVAEKAGLTVPQLSSAIGILRRTAPDLDQVMRAVRTSRARFLALAELKAHRRLVALKDREKMAQTRLQLAPERVRKDRQRRRDWAELRRVRVARQVLALADPLLKAAAQDMREFDRRLGLCP